MTSPTVPAPTLPMYPQPREGDTFHVSYLPDRDALYKLALDSGLIDSDLSDPDNWMTDYGSCEDQITAFAKGCYEAGVQAERERAAAQWESAHGFDKYGVAAAIRKG
jgi:hypothetical protein